MPLNDKYSRYEDYIEDTVEALNECSTIVSTLQRSTYNPEVMALTFSIQVLIDLVADASALALSNNASLREHEFKINEIVQYLT
jgi:hypothetical protein